MPDRVREDWRGLIDSYFRVRQSLKGLLMTVDVRRGLLDADRTMAGWAGEFGLPVTILLTKADKLSRGAGASVRLKLVRELGEANEIVLFSAVDGTGVEAARARLGAWLDGEPAIGS